MHSQLNSLAKKRILIFGLGREGQSTYRFLRSQFPDLPLVLSDEKPLADLNSEWSQIIEEDKLATFSKEVDGFDLIFRSPGIPLAKVKVKAPKATITSNTELFFDLFPGQIIGVTGTKGKSTTTALIHHLLKENNLPALLGGNIGVAPLDLLGEEGSVTNKTIAVLELSSHQLIDLKSSPQITVVQDIFSEHLDYYQNFEEYFEAKTQIARFQTEKDLIVYNSDSETASRLADLSPAKKQAFSLQDEISKEITDSNPLPGKHNLYNIFPAVIIGKHFGLTTAQIATAIKTFQPLSHRLELVAKVKGVGYYNDSLATTPPATMVALEAFGDQSNPSNGSIILIAGGHERDQDFSQLAQQVVKLQVKKLVLLPPTGERLKLSVEKLGFQDTELVDSMSEAVKIASQASTSGDVVLLSPASASFGMFRDYQDRGDQFRDEVEKLKL